MNLDNWPVEAGRYTTGDKESCVAVCTLSSLDIELPTNSIAIIGKCVTENIGIEKIIKNIIANPNIRYLVLCGKEPEGHYVGQALLCLRDNGVDENRKIIGAKGAMPVLKNVDKKQIDCFYKQVELIDLIGEENPDIINKRIEGLIASNPGAFNNEIDVNQVETIRADYNKDKDDTADDKLDGGFFTISTGNKEIIVEHYIDRKINKKIVGKTAEQIMGTIVKLGLVKGLYHSAYLGKELKKAEIALKTGKDYEQDEELKL